MAALRAHEEPWKPVLRTVDVDSHKIAVFSLVNPLQDVVLEYLALGKVRFDSSSAEDDFNSWLLLEVAVEGLLVLVHIPVVGGNVLELNGPVELRVEVAPDRACNQVVAVELLPGVR